MKVPHFKLFEGKYLFPGGSTHILVNKYWMNSYFPVNNYWGVLISGEYLLTVTPVQNKKIDEHHHQIQHIRIV